MKVLFVNSVCGIRSTGRIVTDLAEDFIRQGHKCIIAYGRESVPVKYKDISYRIGTETDVKLNGQITIIPICYGFIIFTGIMLI